MRIKIETILAFIIVKLFFIIIYLEYIEKKVIVLCEKDVFTFFYTIFGFIFELGHHLHSVL